MISGTSMKRNMSDIRTEGIEVKVDGVPNGPFLPNSTSHPNGYNTVVLLANFPSCGKADGQLDSENHFDHMTWPKFTPDGKGSWAGWFCPDDYPIKYPTILHEVAWYFDKTKKQQLVLSNGDALGPSLHADFVSGWDMELLAQVIAQNGNYNGCGDNYNGCPVFSDKTIDDNGKARDCRYAGQIPDEDVGLFQPLDQLPGCNPLWEANGPVDKPTNCPWYHGDPGWVSPNAYMFYDRKTVPQAVNIPVGSTIANISHPNIPDQHLGVWGSDDATNKGKVLVGTDEEVRAGGVKKRVVDVYGLETSCEFTGMYPPCPATVYQTFGTDMSATPVVANVCGATNTKGAVFNTKAYIPGPKPTITTIGCDGAAPTNVTLPTNTTSSTSAGPTNTTSSMGPTNSSSIAGPTNTSTTSSPLPTNTSSGVPSNTTSAGPTSSGNTTALPTSSGNATAPPTSSVNSTSLPSSSANGTATPTSVSSTSSAPGTVTSSSSSTGSGSAATTSTSTTGSGSAASTSPTGSGSAATGEPTSSGSITGSGSAATGEPTGSGSAGTATPASSTTSGSGTAGPSPTDSYSGEPATGTPSSGSAGASPTDSFSPTPSGSYSGEPATGSPSSGSAGPTDTPSSGSETPTPTSKKPQKSCKPKRKHKHKRKYRSH